MGRVKAIIATLLTLMLSGCTLSYTRVGEEIPETQGLEIGVTTREVALAQLGAPLFTRRQFDGELYVWRRERGRSRSITVLPVLVQLFSWEDTRLLRDEVALLFDREGILRGIGRRIETGEDGQSMLRPTRATTLNGSRAAR
jgi:outer membrane protein assembly factor BamE (lipoprotein component of BamABCDE complex)